MVEEDEKEGLQIIFSISTHNQTHCRKKYA
jgi:hypothetical protein